MTVLKERADEAASLIEGAFVWHLTKQGHDYWANIVKELRHIKEVKS